MFKRKKVKLPHRQPTEFERFRAFVAHEEKEKSRNGYETFAEANDFDIPEDADPLEHYFSKETHSEQIARLTEKDGDEFVYLNPDGSIRAIKAEPEVLPPPPTPTPARQNEAPSGASLDTPLAESGL